ncbi:hypothetical protein GCM10009734_28770 [Nonomuraea bangladeshensis]
MLHAQQDDVLGGGDGELSSGSRPEPTRRAPRPRRAEISRRTVIVHNQPATLSPPEAARRTPHGQERLLQRVVHHVRVGAAAGQPGAQPGGMALVEDAQGGGAAGGDGGDEVGVAAFRGDVRGRAPPEGERSHGVSIAGSVRAGSLGSARLPSGRH